jgi:aconitate hydratase
MKAQNVSQKISSHLISGEMIPGTEIGLKLIKLLQDATGTLVMLVRSFELKEPNRK